MSQAESPNELTNAEQAVVVQPAHPMPHPAEGLAEILQRVTATISPVWPLQDYVAINPYAGISDKRFLTARGYLRIFSDCETLMPLDHYAKQFAGQRFTVADIDAALTELPQSGIKIAAGTTGRSIADTLAALPKNAARHDAADRIDIPASRPNLDRRIRTVSDYLDLQDGTQWTRIITEEASRHLAAHYDQGQAGWPSPWKHLPLFQAWRSAASIARSPEVLGIRGFRKFVSQLPHTADAAIVHCLSAMGVPSHLWETFLLCQAFTLPGWSAWAKYSSSEQDNVGSEQDDVAGLLAIRLAYEAALCQSESFGIAWNSIGKDDISTFNATLNESSDELKLRYTLLRASEIHFRDALLDSIDASAGDASSDHQHATDTRPLAQMVFCIDVRSERFRRKLESLRDDIQTCGFAGFFLMPIEYVLMGSRTGSSQVPVLLKPEFKLHEGIRCDHDDRQDDGESECRNGQSDTQWQAGFGRRQIRTMRIVWSKFQASAVGCFSFVETTGLLFGWALLGRVLGWKSTKANRSASNTAAKFDGVGTSGQSRLGPTLEGLDGQGVTPARQADLAAAMLKNLGLTSGFGRLVVLCGHGSQTENNPLAAGLDCGACGGHSGEPNARFAADLLNRPFIRRNLAERGICIPEDTRFVAALHNTTTDEVEFFDTDALPMTHVKDLAELTEAVEVAGMRTREERMPIVDSASMADLIRRSGDWSEVRPEWGLAGNAAFIIAPRNLTKSIDLKGRSFLHCYDHTADTDGSVLENIMTAPMIVAQWINMQYYASTVDNHHFGSGNKTVHNVVGRFGVQSGNGGDLMTGLPWQSLHTGDDYQHAAMRLLTIIAAPRAAIDRVIEKHDDVETLLTNGWIHLVAIEDGQKYRYTEEGVWERLAGVTA